MRFTLPKLFLAVTLAAVTCAAAMSSTRWWAQGIFIFTVLLFVFMAIRAIVYEGQIRAVSFAFALVGGGYLLLSVCGPFAPVRDLLGTNQAISAIGKSCQLSRPRVYATWTDRNGVETQFTGFADNLVKEAPHDARNLKSLPLPNENWPDEFQTNVGISIHPSIPEHAFLLIGHCVFSWIFALLASWLAAWMYAKREKQLANNKLARQL